MTQCEFIEYRFTAGELVIECLQDTDYVFSLPGAKNWQGSAYWAKKRDWTQGDINEVLAIPEPQKYSAYYSYLGMLLL